ncbi:MAG: urease accessory protein UreF [Bacteroidales bacterium]|nr:urease accessory protein UreF [Bacteroidales bacterium]MBQ5505206.1 urease accessory protein UreF [Aeriscardovia sp.]MBQ5505241.1 urease accessory protein UreF [Aeriscardovia sp.]
MSTSADSEKEYRDIRKILEVFQICDSTFPIGTFNHSYGMETYLRDGIVDSNETFEKWLSVYLRTQFKWGEGLAVKLTLEALDNKEHGKLWEYDQLLTRSAAAFETRRGARLIAVQMLDLLLRLYGKDDCVEVKLLQEYRQRIRDEKSFGSQSIAFALFMHMMGEGVRESVCYYSYSIVTTMVQNAVRAIPLGQKAGQKILHDIFDDIVMLSKQIEGLDESYLGASVPGIELAQIRHETTVFRLFMS